MIKDFEAAGSEAHNMEWTDEQLNRQLKVLPCVINYLKNRKDCGMLVIGLNMELRKYEDYWHCRDVYKEPKKKRKTKKS